jgi:hypothetical protein
MPPKPAASQPQPDAPRKLYKVTSPFAVFDRNGAPRHYTVGQVVAADDPILRTHGGAFTEVVPHGVEQATAAPGEVRNVTPPSAS